jgi:hypothetical protein
VAVISLTWETVATNVINQLASATTKLSTTIKIRKYKGLHEKHHFIPMAMEVHDILKYDMDLSFGNVLIFSTIDNQEFIYPCLFAFNFSNML